MTATLILIALALLAPLVLALYLSARYRRLVAPLYTRPKPGRDERTWDELDEDERAYLRWFHK